MTTYDELLEFAMENDGECVVCLVNAEIVLLTDPPSSGVWDYFFSDESEYFDYQQFGIASPST